MVQNVIAFRPQAGPQEAYLATSADICFYGGAAFGGKTFGSLLEPLRHAPRVKDFYAVFFRRNTTQIRNPGGLWDESMKIYPLAGGKPTENVLEWDWFGAGKVKMAHLEHETSVHSWQGSQIPLIIFDELTHFTAKQFWYMFSRNRSTCGVRPYIRATCNPDADSWVAEFITWWIDQVTGFAIPERSGVIRWFVRLNGKVLWADSRQALFDKYGIADLPEDHEDQIHPKSFTFIGAKITDNKIGMAVDPDYIGNLKAMDVVEQARLLGGNWKIRPAAGLYFRREWVAIVDAVPADLEIVRYWDLAATEKTEKNDPDWTVGLKLAIQRSTGRFFVLDVRRFREDPFGVEQGVKNTAISDGKKIRIGGAQDPGQAGKAQVRQYATLLTGYNYTAQPESGDKVTRFGAFSAQCKAGNVSYLRGAWNDEHFTCLEGFPDVAHDDDVDASSGAFEMLTNSDMGFLEYYRALSEEKKAREAAETNLTPSEFIRALQ